MVARVFQVTEQNRQKVRTMAAVGVPQDQIARALGVSTETVRRHFKQDLELAAVEANSAVAGRLFKLAMEGDVVACIYWTKARMGWTDRTTVHHTHSVALSHEERLALLERGDDTPMIEGDAVDVSEPAEIER